MRIEGLSDMGHHFLTPYLSGNPHQDSWLCAQNGEVTLALELAFLSILGDGHGWPSCQSFNSERASNWPWSPKDTVRPASVFQGPVIKSRHCQRGQGDMAGKEAWPWKSMNRFWCFSLLPEFSVAPAELKKHVLYLWWKNSLCLPSP